LLAKVKDSKYNKLNSSCMSGTQSKLLKEGWCQLDDTKKREERRLSTRLMLKLKPTSTALIRNRISFLKSFMLTSKRIFARTIS
jgi:hypothetical protein